MKSKTMPRIFSVLMTVLMALSLMTCALASEYHTNNLNETLINGSVSYSTQNYSVVVSAPSDTSNIEMSATLYQKQLFGYKEIDSMSASSSYSSLYKSEPCTILSGKTYKLEITAQIYSGGQCDTIEKSLVVNT
ncbi:MAG: hypothetical protein VB112_03545 [Oscillospiraceae bacterium]|nr:hypothetical protein [Oscillospiraceae bacterium]